MRLTRPCRLVRRNRGLELAAQRISDFHLRQSLKMRASPMRPKWAIVTGRCGCLYVPGGLAVLFQRIDERHSGALPVSGALSWLCRRQTGRLTRGFGRGQAAGVDEIYRLAGHKPLPLWLWDQEH